MEAQIVIRVLLVQDEDVVRSALAAMLQNERDLEVVGQVGHEDDVAGTVGERCPDVVLLHYGAGGHYGAGRVGQISAAHRLAADLVGVAVVALMGAATRAALAQAVEGSVRGFVDTDAPPDELIRVIRLVAAGEQTIGASLVASWVQGGVNPLTARERAVLCAVSEGLKSDEIGERLFMAHGTVRNYVSVILRKTGARTRLEAVRRAHEAGWI